MRRFELVRGSRSHRVYQGVLLAIVAAIIISLPYNLQSFRVFQMTEVVLFAVAVMGLNLLTGYNGQISLGHSFFFALGAYTTTVLILDHGWNEWMTLPIAFALTFVAGFLFGIPALRLEGLYLALVTLALAVVTPPFIKRFDSITGGSQGRLLKKPTAPGWTGLADDQWRYFAFVAVAVVMFLIARNLVVGRVGRALTAVRDNELAAEAMGVNLAVFKTLVFAYSAAFAGVAGGMFALLVGSVSPGSFEVVLAIGFLAAMVVGGLASIAGPVFGALFYVFVPVYAGDINKALAGVIYGASLILVMFLMPSGVSGLLRRIQGLVLRIVPPGGAGVADRVDELAVSTAFGTGGDDAWKDSDTPEDEPEPVSGPER